MFEVGDRVKVILDGWKDDYPGIYTIKEKKQLGDGKNLYKVGFLPDYALGSMIELVEKKQDVEVRRFKKNKEKLSIFCPCRYDSELQELIFTDEKGDIVYDIKEAAGYHKREDTEKEIRETFDEPDEWGIIEKIVTYKIGDITLP